MRTSGSVMYLALLACADESDDSAVATAPAAVPIACALTMTLSGGTTADVAWSETAEDGVGCDGAGDADAASLLLVPESAPRVVIGWWDGGPATGTFPGRVSVARSSTEAWITPEGGCEVEIRALVAIEGTDLPEWRVSGGGTCEATATAAFSDAGEPVRIDPFAFSGLLVRAQSP